MLTLKRMFSLFVVMAMVMVSCSKEAREPIDLNIYDTQYELQAESCLDCAMHFGIWTHSYGQDDGLLHHSKFILDHNANIDPNDPRSVLCEFMESIPESSIQIFHVWNNLDRLEVSTNNYFTIRWSYVGERIAGAVLVEKESGRIHTLIIEEE